MAPVQKSSVQLPSLSYGHATGAFAINIWVRVDNTTLEGESYQYVYSHGPATQSTNGTEPNQVGTIMCSSPMNGVLAVSTTTQHLVGKVLAVETPS